MNAQGNAIPPTTTSSVKRKLFMLLYRIRIYRINQAASEWKHEQRKWQSEISKHDIINGDRGDLSMDCDTFAIARILRIENILGCTPLNRINPRKVIIMFFFN
jgi:hypothetical protein